MVVDWKFSIRKNDCFTEVFEISEKFLMEDFKRNKYFFFKVFLNEALIMLITAVW